MLNVGIQSSALLLVISIWRISEALHLVGNFSEGSPVYGVGSTGCDVYVIHESDPCIHVYSRSLGVFNRKQLINVSEMGGPYDLVLSNKLESVFIVDWFDPNKIFQVDLRAPHPSRKFPSNNGTVLTTVALSPIQGSENILVTESRTSVVKEFSPNGTLVKSVILDDIKNPRHAVKMSTQLYAVCFGGADGSLHQVCLVDGNGGTVPGRCFGGDHGNSTSQLNFPSRMSLLRDGSILVADMKNRRVLKLRPPFVEPAKVIVSEKDGLAGPYRIFLDEDRDWLYVGDNTPDPETGYAIRGRVLVYKL